MSSNQSRRERIHSYRSCVKQTTLVLMVSLSLLASLRKQHLSKNSICIVSCLKPFMLFGHLDQKKTTLETMVRSAWLRHWRRTSHSMRFLWRIIYSIFLFLPNFEYNNIGNDGARTFEEVLKANKTLTNLELRCKSLSLRLFTFVVPR